MSYLTMKDGVKIYYEDHGKGETILFLHGLNSSHLKIKNFIEKRRNTPSFSYGDISRPH